MSLWRDRAPAYTECDRGPSSVAVFATKRSGKAMLDHRQPGELAALAVFDLLLSSFAPRKHVPFAERNATIGQ